MAIAPLLFLAEDDTELRWALAMLLRSFGWDIHEVDTGADLLDAVSGAVLEGRERVPDLIITDVRMPGVCGLSIIEGLRALGCSTPVIVMSAYGDAQIRARVQLLQSTAFLDKPLDLNQLETALKSLTG